MSTSTPHYPHGRGSAGAVYLLGASFATRNLGVGALSDGALRMLVNAYGGHVVRLVEYGANRAPVFYQLTGSTMRIPVLSVRFSKNILDPTNIAHLLVVAGAARFLPGAAGAALLRRNSVLSDLSGARIVAAISGGDSFSDIYGLRRFLYVTLPQVLALLLRRPLLLLPQTYGPFRSLVSRVIARLILKRAAFILCRDHVGRAYVEHIAGSLRARPAFCFDVAFGIESRAPSHTPRVLSSNRAAEVFGLNVSGLLAMGGYTRANMFGLRVDYMTLMHDIIVRIIGEGTGAVVLVPHVLGDPHHAESDVGASRRVLEGLEPRIRRRVRLADGSVDQREAKYVIGRCGFFCGSRMHACIAALSQAVPAAGLAYSDKFAGVFESVGVPELALDLRRLSAEDIASSVLSAYRRRDALRERLRKRADEIRRVLDTALTKFSF